MKRRSVLLLAAFGSAALVRLILPFSAGAHPGPLHIHELRASVTTEKGVQWVNVRGYVCVRSSSEASRTAPDELRLTQFIVYKGQWRPVWSGTQYDQWVVSLGESWPVGSACGWVSFRDVFARPEGFAGFGSRINCFGVAFSLKFEGRTATKRVTIKCPKP